MVGKRVRVRVGDEERVLAVRTRVVIGDRVRLSGDQVDEVLPRRTVLERTGESRGHVVCANADLLVIVAAASDPPFRPGLVDRLWVAGRAGGLECRLVLNKCDAGMEEEVLGWIATYEDLGLPIHMVSATRQKGLETLIEALRDRTSVLVGHSGVGKSSLTNALVPGAGLAVGELDPWGRGRHTTIAGRILALPGGGRIVDLPGVREFGIGHVPKEELRRYFPEIALAPCRYRSCLHDGEEGCVAAELIAEPRLESYRKLLAELL